jgi:hypothetical protein
MAIPTELPLWVYAAVGVLLLWGKMKLSSRNVYALTDIVNLLIPVTWPRLRGIVELTCYIAIGSIISLGVLEPSTPGQAFAAGLGWTSLTTR